MISALGFAHGISITRLIIVFNNGAYRAMQTAQLMKAFDAYGEKVADPGEIVPALGRARTEMQKGRSALLDVMREPGNSR